MAQETLRENKMGTMPENRLLLSMAVPMMISMLVQALYNIVDSIFVSRICEDALTAVSMAFPLQNIIISIAVGFGVGINALLSRALGQKNAERVNQVAVNGLLLALLSYLLVLVAGLLGIRAYMHTQTDIETIVNFGITYLNICILCSFGVFIEITFERFLQATGRTIYSMITQLVGAITNIILDPILIFGLLGFPKMGIAGAAWATVIGQCLGAVVAVILNHCKNPEIHLRLRHIRPSGKLMGEITAISIPSIIMSCISSLTCFVMNLILITFSSTAVAVFGVYFKLQSFVFMPVFGLNNGMVPIIAYNYGAQKSERIHKTIRLGMVYAVAIMMIGLLVFQLIPKELLLSETFISREKSSGTYQAGREILERMGVDIAQLRTAIEVRSSESVKQMVGEGLGIGLISLSAARDYVQFEKVLAFPFEEEELRRRLYIVKHKNSILSPIAQVFYDYARKYYEKHPEKAPE